MVILKSEEALERAVEALTYRDNPYLGLQFPSGDIATWAAEAVLTAIGYDELVAENERLRAALWEIAGLTDQYGPRPDAVVHVKARAAVDPPTEANP